jgi:hypothetical protein
MRNKWRLLSEIKRRGILAALASFALALAYSPFCGLRAFFVVALPFALAAGVLAGKDAATRLAAAAVSLLSQILAFAVVILAVVVLIGDSLENFDPGPPPGWHDSYEEDWRIELAGAPARAHIFRRGNGSVFRD